MMVESPFTIDHGDELKGIYSFFYFEFEHRKNGTAKRDTMHKLECVTKCSIFPSNTSSNL